jgi:catechol 2,3-dioxygenase
MNTSTAGPFANRVEVGIHPSPYRLPDKTRVGRARLAVSSLERSVDFYTSIIGLPILFETTSDKERVAYLGIKGTDEVLLELHEIPGVHSIGHGTRLGLYHTAFLLPTREALASFVLHLKSREVPFGSSDHLYSEALYFTDPDGLTVEVYADRPREQWTVEGRELITGVTPLRFQDLLSVARGTWSGAPLGTSMGHLHFFVGDLEKAKTFYHHGLGLDIMTWR